MSRLQIDGRLPVENVGADHEVDMRNRVAHKVRLGDEHRYHGQRCYGLQRWREGKRVYLKGHAALQPITGIIYRIYRQQDDGFRFESLGGVPQHLADVFATYHKGYQA